MPKRTFRKLDIAHEYLSVAAELYFHRRYFPALALAAMAEEIFEAVMRARNVPHPSNPVSGLRFVPDKHQPISQELIAIARALNPALRRLKDAEVYRRLYRAKNSRLVHRPEWAIVFTIFFLSIYFYFVLLLDQSANSNRFTRREVFTLGVLV